MNLFYFILMACCGDKSWHPNHSEAGDQPQGFPSAEPLWMGCQGVFTAGSCAGVGVFVQGKMRQMQVSRRVALILAF